MTGPVASTYGFFDTEKDYKAHLKKIEKFKKAGEYNAWLLAMPKPAFAVWIGTDSAGRPFQGTWFVTRPDDRAGHDEIEGALLGGSYWATVNMRTGKVRYTHMATHASVTKAIKRKEREGFNLKLELTSSPPKFLNTLPMDDELVRSLRDGGHKRDVWECHNRSCTNRGVQVIDRDERHWYAYTLCEEHRTDVLDPIHPTSTCQTGDGKNGYIVHLVRSNQNGGTPGPTLCGLSRFGKNPDIKGFSIGGGHWDTANNRPLGERCAKCIQAKAELLESAEFLKRRNLLLERLLGEAEAEQAQRSRTYHAELAKAHETRAALADEVEGLETVRDALNELIDDREQRVVDLRESLNNANTRVQTGVLFAADLIPVLDRVVDQISKTASSRLSGFVDAVLEPVYAQAHSIAQTGQEEATS